MEPISQLRSQIESILLVIDEPIMTSKLAEVLEIPEDRARAELRAIAEELDERCSGMELREDNDSWRLYTRKANAPIVEKLLLHGSHNTLSRAAMETLAIVAYRQPVTRAQVASIRGVNVDGVMRGLAQRGLIEEAQAPHHYQTTPLFLELLGIPSLDVLPNLAPLLPDMAELEDIDQNGR
ncbi:MAG: SMC-Scp complex subunit ScpB [Corynebacterium sp.]|nr:SMC-Scp complex subunit ScpB [Corynebacterium sp.]